MNMKIETANKDNEPKTINIDLRFIVVGMAFWVVYLIGNSFCDNAFEMIVIFMLGHILCNTAIIKNEKL
ncbi:hypothetical protein [Bacillus wiedmannii]|uniref:hypothetical protein n=1 Tax=Bacillus wiedmannii TaxID=1890302 RepID=UPI003D1A4287